jgi:hypothetical protein
MISPTPANGTVHLNADFEVDHVVKVNGEVAAGP